MSALVEPVEPAAKADPVEEVVAAEDDENNNNESMDKALITNDDESKEKEVDEDISDESDDDMSQYDINNLLESDAVVVGNYVGIIRYLGPLFLDPFNTQKTTQEQYIGIECLSEQDVGDKGHDGWYNQFRYFKTKNSRKTGILIQASEFKKN